MLLLILCTEIDWQTAACREIKGTYTVVYVKISSVEDMSLSLERTTSINNYAERVDGAMFAEDEV